MRLSVVLALSFASRSSSARQTFSRLLGALHVDQVEDDQPADVAEAELVGDLVDGLEVGLERRLFQVLAALADEAPGVDVDRRERLGLIDDQRAAAR